MIRNVICNTDDDAGTQTGSPARPPSDIRSLLTSRGKPLAPAFLQTTTYPPSQLAVEDCLCPKRHLCCVKLSVSYPLNITSISINWEISFHFCKIPVLFCRIHRILVKVEQGFFNRQMTFGHIRLSTASCEGGRTKLSHSDIHGQSD